MSDPIQGQYLPGALSARYQNSTTSVTKRIADMVKERGIEAGMLSVKVARQVDPKLCAGDTVQIGGATFMVMAR